MIMIAAAALLLPGCSTPAPLPEDTYPPRPDARTHWELRHRVVESRGLQVVSQSLGHGEESTGVLLVEEPTQRTEDCFVAVSVRGQGGPENMVGEKTPTTFDGHPAFRDGAGAEGAYLMWQLPDESWVQVHCSSDTRASIDQVAAAVDLKPITMRIPFDLTLPPHYGLSILSVDLQRSSGRVYLGRVGQHPRPPEGDLEISYGYPELSLDPVGEPTTINGRPARVDETEKSPAIWLQEQGRWVYVGIAPSDTGPYPDRSDELPVLRSLAESISFAEDLGNSATWFSAENVFG